MNSRIASMKSALAVGISAAFVIATALAMVCSGFWHGSAADFPLALPTWSASQKVPALATDADATAPPVPAPTIPLQVTPVVADPGANPRNTGDIIPVHVVTRRNLVHPGIAYDFFNDSDQPLNLQITLQSPLHMPKKFDCHLEAGKGNYCELGFEQGFSGSLGDTLTIEGADYLPLIFKP